MAGNSNLRGTESLDPLNLAAILWRRKLLLLPPVVAGVAAAVLALAWLPPVYRARTTIMVEEQKVPSKYVESTITATAQERLRTIEQQVTSRPALERVILELDLYPEARQERPIEDIVQRMRRDLQVRVERNTVFSISFQGADPETVAATANRVADLFIQENLELRESQAQSTSAFLERELSDMKAQLEEHEAKIAAFRQRHEGQLPAQKEGLVRALAQLEARFQRNRDELDKAQLSRQLLETTQSPPLEIAVTAPPQATRLQELKLQLVELRSRLTEEHPDVIRLQREIEGLERALAEAPPVAPIEPRATVDPTLQAKLDAVDRETAGLEAERAQILADMRRLQQRLDSIPRVEQELLILTRDYDKLQGSYDSLLAKRLEARLAENLEKSQQGEQFRILERAFAPTKPIGPSKRFALGLGLAGGLALGLALALVRERMDQTFTTAESLREAFPGAPIVASIPLIPASPKQARRLSRSMRRTA